MKEVPREVFFRELIVTFFLTGLFTWLVFLFFESLVSSALSGILLSLFLAYILTEQELIRKNLTGFSKEEDCSEIENGFAFGLFGFLGTFVFLFPKISFLGVWDFVIFYFLCGALLTILMVVVLSFENQDLQLEEEKNGRFDNGFEK